MSSDSAVSHAIWNRRTMLASSASGFGLLALADLLARGETSGRPHFRPRASRVIFLFMHGGPSHVDTFDHKPELTRRDGQPLPFAKPRIQFARTGNLLRSPWAFRRHGARGAWVSDLFPHVAGHVDDLTFVHSLHGSNPAHGGALLKIHTGSDTFVRPSLGSWISYGLGTENDSLPAFVTINPTLGHGGVRNFGPAFLPPVHQATRIDVPRTPPHEPQFDDLAARGVSASVQRLQLDLLADLDRLRRPVGGTADATLDARIDSFETAFRMQAVAPGLLDLASETVATLRLYGIDGGPAERYGRQCLLARRLSEAGVRFVQVTHSYWDQHDKLAEKHQALAGEVDRPIAGLLADLKQRGLLDDTLVIWGGEFGRTPTAQGTDGRDHNPHGFTWWLAGGGVKRCHAHGSTDEFGYYAVEDKVHVHDLHATILHLLGIDHERLTYRHGGRDFRLTDVEGRIVKEIIA